MKSALAFILASTAAALPASERQVADQTIRFYGLSIRSGSHIQYASVNANGLQFWLDKNTTTYCPDNVGDACDTVNTNSTVFTKDLATDTLSLDTIVPGGQQVYVASNGLLRFTQAHSAYPGDNSTETGFLIAQGKLWFEGSGFLACPTQGSYEIYASSKYDNSAGPQCLGFDFRAIEPSDDVQPAWQYE